MYSSKLGFAYNTTYKRPYIQDELVISFYNNQSTGYFHAITPIFIVVIKALKCIYTCIFQGLYTLSIS